MQLYTPGRAGSAIGAGASQATRAAQTSNTSTQAAHTYVWPIQQMQPWRWPRGCQPLGLGHRQWPPHATCAAGLHNGACSASWHGHVRKQSTQSLRSVRSSANQPLVKSTLLTAEKPAQPHGRSEPCAGLESKHSQHQGQTMYAE
jgi:hypothetical protein